MSLFEAIFLGIIEGLTEFLPISSTGHLIIVGTLLKIHDSVFHKAFNVIIQSGAMLAVVYYYRKMLVDMLRKALQKNLKPVLRIVVAFLPAAFFGGLFHHLIKYYLFGVAPVALALVLGGIALIICEKNLPHYSRLSRELSYKDAFIIGMFQCLALWPGTSRSMATILGGRVVGLSAKDAAEFSFLLAIPTLLAAGLFDFLNTDFNIFMEGDHLTFLIVGIIVSFFVSLLVIKWFLNFLSKYDLSAFGWYRIIIGIFVYWMLTY